GLAERRKADQGIAVCSPALLTDSLVHSAHVTRQRWGDDGGCRAAAGARPQDPDSSETGVPLRRRRRRRGRGFRDGDASAVFAVADGAAWPGSSSPAGAGPALRDSTLRWSPRGRLRLRPLGCSPEGARPRRVVPRPRAVSPRSSICSAPRPALVRFSGGSTPVAPVGIPSAPNGRWAWGE